MKYMNILIRGGGLKTRVPGTIGTILEKYIPIIRMGIVTIIPANGPLYPRSKSEFLSGIGDLTLITAPNVPINVGAE